MATLGQILKEAREQKNITASQAAAATRMKIQTIEALEGDDFSRIAAPTYAKGFIKLYAEYLGLDPTPLIREYMDLHAPKTRSPLTPENGAPKQKKIKIDWPQLKPRLTRWKRPISVGAGALVFLAVGALGIARCSRQTVEPSELAAPPSKKVVLPVIREPPEPYMETSRAAPKTP